MELAPKSSILLRRIFCRKKKFKATRSRESLNSTGELESVESSETSTIDSDNDYADDNIGEREESVVNAMISPPKSQNSITFVMTNIQEMLKYMKGLNAAAETVNAKQAKKWREYMSLLDKEAERLEMQYKELEGTLHNINVIKHQIRAVRKDQKNMQNTLDCLQRQEEGAMETEIRKYEDGLLGQYRKALFSGECKTAELEALQGLTAQKRKALDMLDELITRALSSPPADCMALSKVVARRGARFPASRTEALRAHARARRREREMRLERSSSRSTSPVTSDSSSELARPDTSIRTLFGDLFVQAGQEEPEIIPLTYFETSV